MPLTRATDFQYNDCRVGTHLEIGGHEIADDAFIVGLWFVPFTQTLFGGRQKGGDWLAFAWCEMLTLHVHYRFRSHASPWTDLPSAAKDTKLWYRCQLPWESDMGAVRSCQHIAELIADSYRSDVDCFLILGDAPCFLDKIESDAAPTWLNFR